MSLHLKRRFVQEFVQNHGRRVQNFHFRLMCVARKRRCWNSLVCALYLGVNVFSTKVLILRGDRHFTWSSVPREGLTVWWQREYLHFSVILRPWALVRPRESNPHPPALHSSALPTELNFLRFLLLIAGDVNVFIRDEFLPVRFSCG